MRGVVQRKNKKNDLATRKHKWQRKEKGKYAVRGWAMHFIENVKKSVWQNCKKLFLQLCTEL